MPTMDAYGNSTNGTGTIAEYTAVNLNSIDIWDISYAAEECPDDAANQAQVIPPFRLRYS